MTAGIAELSALLAEVDRAIAALEQHASDIARHRPAGVPDPPGESELAFIGVQMSAWYNALEDLFSRVARAFGESPAAGDAWHMEVLRRMAAPAPHVRPAVVAPTLYAALLSILKFRHFLRHAYAVRLDWTKMAPAVEALTGSHPQGPAISPAVSRGSGSGGPGDRLLGAACPTPERRPRGQVARRVRAACLTAWRRRGPGCAAGGRARRRCRRRPPRR